MPLRSAACTSLPSLRAGLSAVPTIPASQKCKHLVAPCSVSAGPLVLLIVARTTMHFFCSITHVELNLCTYLRGSAATGKDRYGSFREFACS